MPDCLEWDTIERIHHRCSGYGVAVISSFSAITQNERPRHVRTIVDARYQGHRFDQLTMTRNMDIGGDHLETAVGADNTDGRPIMPDLPAAVARKPQSPRSRQSKWSWTILNFWLDCTLLVNFLVLVWVATVVRFVFPPATSAQGWMLWGYSINAWLQLQFALIASLSLGILVHLMLHWSWVCGVFFSRIWRRRTQAVKPDDGTRTIYGVGLMIVVLNVLGILIAAAALSIQSPG